MEVLYFLIPIGLIFLLIAIRLLFWAINSGQYDDLETEASRILFDDSSTSLTGSSRSSTDSPTAQKQPNPSQNQ